MFDFILYAEQNCETKQSQRSMNSIHVDETSKQNRVPGEIIRGISRIFKEPHPREKVRPCSRCESNLWRAITRSVCPLTRRIYAHNGPGELHQTRVNTVKGSRY